MRSVSLGHPSDPSTVHIDRKLVPEICIDKISRFIKLRHIERSRPDCIQSKLRVLLLAHIYIYIYALILAGALGRESRNTKGKFQVR